MLSKECKTSVHVVWYKRDLRVADHRPLSLAAARGPVLPLVVIEPDFWHQPDMSARQYSFYRECILDLSDALAALGQPLVVHVGGVSEALESISSEAEISSLWSHEETGNDWTFRRDVRVADWCRQNGIRWNELPQNGVIRRLKSRDGWAKKWNKLMAEPITPAPLGLSSLPRNFEDVSIPTADEIGLLSDIPKARQRGGRAFALSTLSSFLQARGEPYRSAMSSPVAGERACSRLSPYLAWGTVSMREVAQTTWQRQRELKQLGGKSVSQWRGSLLSFSGRLHWHCHFMQKLEDEPRLEFRNLHPAYDALRSPKESDAACLAAWKKGETGLPFVDACMRYLGATGWLNFRMRAMLMATASYHLWLHWREPGLHLARQFTDYEPGIHWPQAQMQSGTTGINTVRIYNPVKQGYDQDPDGAFVRRWVPELACIEGPMIHEPWKSPLAVDLLDKVYPMPIVDHMQAAREARQKIYSARKGIEFQKTANAIQTKHGSRKSGIPTTGRISRARKKAPASVASAEQLVMKLVPSASLDGKADR